jgi:hypothetical protein
MPFEFFVIPGIIFLIIGFLSGKKIHKKLNP